MIGSDLAQRGQWFLLERLIKRIQHTRKIACGTGPLPKHQIELALRPAPYRDDRARDVQRAHRRCTLEQLLWGQTGSDLV